MLALSMIDTFGMLKETIILVGDCIIITNHAKKKASNLGEICQVCELNSIKPTSKKFEI